MTKVPWGDLGASPHDFLDVGAIALMSAPMFCIGSTNQFQLYFSSDFTVQCYPERGIGIAMASRPSVCMSVCDVEVLWS